MFKTLNNLARIIHAPRRHISQPPACFSNQMQANAFALRALMTIKSHCVLQGSINFGIRNNRFHA